MGIQVQHRRGTTSDHASFTGANGEITVDTDKKVAIVHDDSTAGGTPLATEAHTHTGYAASDHNHTGTYEPADANIVKDDETSTFTKGQDQVGTVLTSTSNAIALDLASGPVFTHTMTEDSTISAPSNKPASGNYRVFFIIVTQHASSAKALTWNSIYKFPGGTVPALSTSANAVDIFSIIATNGNLYVTSVQDMK